MMREVLVETTRLWPRDFIPFTDWYTVRFTRKRGHVPSSLTLRGKRQSLSSSALAGGASTPEEMGRLLGDRDAVESLLDSLSLSISPGTLRGYCFDLMDYGEYARNRGWLGHVALGKLDLPGANPRKPIVCYSDDDVETLISAARGKSLRWWVFLTFLADTGRRVGEALGLRWEWLRLDAEIPYFELPQTKNGRPQYIPLGPRLRAEVFTPENIEELVHGRDSGFRYERSPAEFPFPWGYGPAAGQFLRYCERVGVTYRGFHNFRHTRATGMLMDGVPIQAVSSLLGHASVATTDRIYNHATALNYAKYLER